MKTGHFSFLLFTGVEENSLDSFVFDTLIPKPITQRYFNLLMEHRRIILSGPSGTGKTYLANRLAEYIITKSGRKKTEDAIATFNVDHKSSKVSYSWKDNLLSNLQRWCKADLINWHTVLLLSIFSYKNSVSSLNDKEGPDSSVLNKPLKCCEGSLNFPSLEETHLKDRCRVKFLYKLNSWSVCNSSVSKVGYIVILV